LNNTLYSVGSFQTGITGFTAVKPRPGTPTVQDLSSISISTVDSLSSGCRSEQRLPTFGIYRRSSENALGPDKEISISTLKELALAGGGFPLSGNTAVAGTLCATLKDSGKSEKPIFSRERQKASDDMDRHTSTVITDRPGLELDKCIYMEFPSVWDCSTADTCEGINGNVLGFESPEFVASVAGALSDVSEQDSSSIGAFDPVKKTSIMDEAKKQLITKLFEKKKACISQRAIEDTTDETQSYFHNRIQNVEKKFKEILGRFPEKILEFWSESDKGNITIVPFIERFSNKVGYYDRSRCIASIRTSALYADNGAVEEEISHMLDHLLGSHGEEIVGTLSSGMGINPKLELFGKEIQDLFKDKTNHVDDYASQNPREFFIQSIRYYLTEPETLQEAFPKVYNIIDTKWFNNEFWKEVL